MTIRGIIVIGWILLIVLCILITSATLYLLFSGQPVSKDLENWILIVIGFLLGILITLMKEFMSNDS